MARNVQLFRGILLRLFMLIAVMTAPAVLAQEAEEKSRLVQYVEETISSPNFQIRLNGLEGSLSSNVTLQSITIADTQGVWLAIEKPQLVWNRSALLTGRVEVESLTAERILLPRTPLPDESAPAPEAKPFALPDLPVSISLKKLTIGRVSFGEPVFGLAAETSVNGAIKLDGGSLDMDLKIARLDGPGGTLAAVGAFNSETQAVKLDIQLDEPQNGVLANALNIEGYPPVSLRIRGDAPLENLKVDIDFDANERRVLAGNVTLSKENGDTRVNAKLAGPLSSILPQKHRAFFGPTSELQANALLKQSGAVDVQSVNIKGGAMNLAARARTMSDGFLAALQLQLRLNASGTERVLLPFGETPPTLSSFVLSADYDAEAASSWKAAITADDVRQGDLTIGSLKLFANGTAENINQPQERAVTYQLSGTVDGLQSKNPALQEAMGRSVALNGDGSWRAGNALELSRFQVNAETFNFLAQGAFAAMAFDGSLKLDANRLTAFSQVADRKLTGRANVQTQGKIEFLTGGFDLKIDGTTDDLSIGETSVDPLLEGTMTLAGRVARGEQGLSFDTLRLASPAFNTVLNGRYASTSADISANAIIKDIAKITPNGSGTLALNAKIAGNNGQLKTDASVSIASGRLQGRAIRDLTLSLDGLLEQDKAGSKVTGALGAKGLLSRRPISLSGQIELGEDKLGITGLNAQVGETQLKGDVTRISDGVFEGEISINSTNISDAAALALVDAQGRVNGAVKLFGTDGMQSLQSNVQVSGVRYEDIRIGSADIVAAIVDLTGKPKIGATVSGSDIRAGGQIVRRLDLKASTQGQTTSFDLDAQLAQNQTRLQTQGTFQQAGTQSIVSLNRLRADTNIADIAMTSPSTLTLKNGTVSTSGLSLSIGSGSVSISGSAGDRLALDVRIQSLPLAIANAVQSGLGAGGVLSATASVRGTPAAPQIAFNAQGNGLTAAQLAQAGVSPLAVNARGQFQNNTVILESFDAQNSQGISLRASGRAPIKGEGLNLRASGTLPLTLAGPALASRGASAMGQARFDVTVGGSASNPRPNGLVSIENASFTDPLSNLKLNNIGLLAGLDGERITINRGGANLSSGGSVAVSGSVGLSGDLPANISVALQNARYTDGQTFDTKASGTLSVTGALLRDPVLGGTILLEKTEITVPETLGGDTKLLDVTHVNPGPQTKQTLQRLERVTPKGAPTSRPSVLRLDLTVNAPNQIFVRGRGLDAELGGRVRVTGPVTNVSPQGSFQLRRGRLSILGQRIDLTEGSVSLTGDLDPFIDLTAKTRGGDVDAFINVKGRSSDIKITFSSSPELPQDEVLARIIFGRGITDLSPAQIARLASSAAELTGGNSPGLVDSIRAGTGLDDLDVVQDSDGNAAVKAGKYINDNVYLGVQAGSKTEATINLDISNSVKARGAVDSEGKTSIGIFLEKDY